MELALIFFLVILGLCLLAVLGMVWVILKGGDERRQMVITQAAANSFYISVGVYLLDLLLRLVAPNFLEGTGNLFSEKLSFLIVCAFIFLINLVLLNRRHGG